jgi:hypothetical protein
MLLVAMIMTVGSTEGVTGEDLDLILGGRPLAGEDANSAENAGEVAET